MVFTLGQKVGVINGNHEFKKGTIEKIFPEIETVLVKLDNDEMIKVKLRDLAIVKEEPTENAEEKKEPVEKSEITITPTKFLEIARSVVRTNSTLDGKFDMMLFVAFTLLMSKLHKALFFDEWEND